MSVCEITGEAWITESDGRPRWEWTRTDPEIHVSRALLDDLDPDALDSLLAMYDLCETCPERPSELHARKREAGR